jgi:hypothetical protein
MQQGVRTANKNAALEFTVFLRLPPGQSPSSEGLALAFKLQTLSESIIAEFQVHVRKK